MTLCLGKLPARPDAATFKFSHFFDIAALPTPPRVFGHKLGLTWGMLANDHVGNCVVAGGMHETMVWSRLGILPPANFTNAAAISDYSAIGGYVPGDVNTDNGLDMEVAAKYRRKTGLTDSHGSHHKIDAYVAVNPHRLDQLATATYLFGAIGLGLMLPESCLKQFDNHQPWSVVHGSRIAGGHYVSVVGRNSAGNFLLITWGRIQAATPSFISEYADESLLYLSTESLDAKGLTPENFDVAKLQSALGALRS